MVNRYALTQPQRNRVITAAVPHPNNSAKSINHKAHKGHKDRTKGLLGYQELDYLCEAFVIFVLFVVKIRYL